MRKTVNMDRFLSAILTAAAILTAGAALAADGTWNGVDGNWTSAGTWTNGIWPGGIDGTAGFTNVDITASKTITNDSPRTIGHIVFSDTVASHDLTITGSNLTLAVTSGSPVIDVANRALTISCALGGTSGITKNGGGTLILAGTNTFTGGMVVNAGTLQAGAVNAFGTNTLNINSGGLVDLNGYNLTQTQVQGVGAVTNSGGACTLTINGQPGNTCSNVFSGAGLSVTFSAFYTTYTLATNSTYGGTTLFSGRSASLKLGVNNALPIGGNVTLFANEDLSELNLNGYNQTVGLLTMDTRWYEARVTGTGSSTLTITNGVAANAISTSTSDKGIYCTTLDLNGANQTFTVSAVAANPDLTITSVIQNGGMIMNGAAASIGLYAANTFSGPTRVSQGIVSLYKFNALQNSPLDTSGAGTVSLSAGAGVYTFGGLNGSKNLASVITGNPTYLVNLVLNPGVGATNTYSGAIGDLSAGMTLTKTGVGTQILSGNNTYSGNTYANAGTLGIGGSSVIADSAALYITTNAIVNLESGVNETVTSLYLDGQEAESGTWGSLFSSARYKWDKYFAGAGTLTVLTGRGVTPLDKGMVLVIR